MMMIIIMYLIRAEEHISATGLIFQDNEPVVC